MTASNSTRSGVNHSQKIREWMHLFMMRWRSRGDVSALRKSLEKDEEEYSRVLRDYGNSSLRESTILEIGYGARPLRLMWLLSRGYNAWGIDLDRPVFRGSPGELWKVYRTNGLQRVMKSAVRHFLFDKQQWRNLFPEWHPTACYERFLVGDASRFNFAHHIPSKVNFVYSEDVFEHIPRKGLEVLLMRLSEIVARDGCCLFRPNIFTGIVGGHFTEWYHESARRRMPNESCRVEPWEHLRKARYKANTYLNELRLKEYRELLERYFYIRDEVFHDVDIGMKHLTSAIERELPSITREELLANTVRFICTPK